MKRQLSLIPFLIVSYSCGSKSSSSGSAATATTDKLQIEGIAVPQLNLVQKADAVTPKGFKTGTTLVQPDGSTVCDIYGGSGDARPGAYWACRAAYEVREAFFQVGPTVIRKRLDAVDDRLNFYVGGLADFEIPCFDSTNTTVRTAETTGGTSGNVTEEIPAFKVVEFKDKTTFSDAHVLDFGRTYYFNCSDSFTSNGYDFNINFGRKDTTWYMAESSKSSTDGGMKTLVSLDKDDNMEILFGIGGADNGVANPESSGTAAVVKSTYYATSNGFAQFVVRPTEGIVAATALLDNGCGSRLVMNDVAVYIETNYNPYGRCYASDIWISDNTYTGRNFFSNRQVVSACLKVSGDLPVPQATLDLCESAGLIVAKDGGGYEDAFAAYDLLNLNNNLSSPPTGGYAMRAYHGGRLWPTLGEGVNKLQRIAYPPEAEVVAKDYVTISASFTPAAGSTTSEASAVSAACNAAQATRETSFSQSWEFKVQNLLDMARATVPEGSELTDEEQDIAHLAAVNHALARTGDLAPRLVTRVVRSLGANFRGVGTGSYTLKYGTETIGTATVDQSTLADDTGNSEVTILLTTVPTVAADGTFTLQFDGKARLECNVANTTVRKANVQLGLAALKYFTQPFEVIE